MEDDEQKSEQIQGEAAPEANEAEVLRAENADLRDRLLRALADAENTRRRAERDKADASQYAITRFARDMLSIADNFSRALAACPPEKREAADPQVKAVIEGVEATERQLLATLELYGVKQIDISDGKFDPNWHQAIAEVPGEGRPAGSIVTVVQPGYRIGERLLRPAMVTVAKADAATNGLDTKA
jgi:molecular chaperone GrpE